jgi:hypothetical protein
MQFSYCIVEQKYPEWAREETRVEWRHTGRYITRTRVVSADMRSMEDTTPSPIWVYSTPDGPIIGLECLHWKQRPDAQVIAYPGVIAYQHGSLQFRPVFNCSDTLFLQKQAIRSMQAPSELLLSAYPGFIIQCKMGKFDINPQRPIHDAEEEITQRHYT